jgi:hypothetical protein
MTGQGQISGLTKPNQTDHTLILTTPPGCCGCGGSGGSSPKTPRGSLRRTMVPSPTSEHALESGIAPLSPGGAGTVRRSLNGGAVPGVGGQQQPSRQALTHLYEVDREEAVDPL